MGEIYYNIKELTANKGREPFSMLEMRSALAI